MGTVGDAFSSGTGGAPLPTKVTYYPPGTLYPGSPAATYYPPVSRQVGGRQEQVVVHNSDGSQTTYTNSGDRPVTGTANATIIDPGCDNPGETVYITPPPEPPGGQTTIYRTDRLQTWDNRAMVSGDRLKAVYTKALVASNPILQYCIRALIYHSQILDIETIAAIQGERFENIRERAAIQTENRNDINILAAIATNPKETIATKSAIEGVMASHWWARAAVKGEVKKRYTVTAQINKTRINEIYLEMENFYPQEFALNGVPNWASEPKDWRKDSLT